MAVAGLFNELDDEAEGGEPELDAAAVVDERGVGIGGWEAALIAEVGGGEVEVGGEVADVVEDVFSLAEGVGDRAVVAEGGDELIGGAGVLQTT